MARTEAMARHLYNRLVEEGHTHTVAWLSVHPRVKQVIICEDEPYRFTDNDVDATVVYIDTDPYKGLTDEQLTEIDEFIEKNY